MMPSQFVIWESNNVPHACCLDRLHGVERQWQLRDGLSRAADFPSDAYYNMDPDFPDDLVLTDNLLNTDMRIVASLRLKQFLEAAGLPQVEFLPVAILDHRQKIASRDYFLVHPIEPVNCLDLEQCGVEWGQVDPESIDRVQRLVIDETRIELDRRLFRPKSFSDVVLVQRDLAQAMDQQSFTGIRWVELDAYPEI